MIEANAVYKKKLLLLLVRCKLKQRGQLRSQPNKLSRYEPFTWFRHEKMVNGKTVLLSLILGSLSNATTTAAKASLKNEFASFKLYHVYLEPFNLSNARQMPYGSSIRLFCLFSTEKALPRNRFFWRKSTLPISY